MSAAELVVGKVPHRILQAIRWQPVEVEPPTGWWYARRKGDVLVGLRHRLPSVPSRLINEQTLDRMESAGWICSEWWGYMRVAIRPTAKARRWLQERDRVEVAG